MKIFIIPNLLNNEAKGYYYFLAVDKEEAAILAWHYANAHNERQGHKAEWQIVFPKLRDAILEMPVSSQLAVSWSIPRPFVPSFVHRTNVAIRRI